MDNNQNAIRAARRLLDDRIRDDWDWPTVPPPSRALSGDDEEEEEKEEELELQGVTEFRERFYATTSTEATEDEDAGNQGATGPYKFDSPDSVGERMREKKERRKRRRREVLREEMKWNEGLEVWIRRRDCWTGGEAVRRVEQRRRRRGMKSANSGSSGAPMEQTWITAQQHERLNPDFPTDSQPTSTSELAQPCSNGTAPSPDSLTTFPPFSSSETLIPIPPPLLANNPIRLSITPKIYPEIYSKVVSSARTPSVPINLSDMTRALVQGWKDSGEWPPKPGPLDPLAGRKRGIARLGVKGKSGVGGIGKGGGLGSGREKSSSGGQGGGHHAEGEFLSHHPHLQKGVESVRRIFHLGEHHGSHEAQHGTHGAKLHGESTVNGV